MKATGGGGVGLLGWRREDAEGGQGGVAEGEGVREGRRSMVVSGGKLSTEMGENEGYGEGWLSAALDALALVRNFSCC